MIEIVLEFQHNCRRPMTYSNPKTGSLTDSEWEELVALKQAINQYPASVHPEKMELFTELLVRSWSSEEQ